MRERARKLVELCSDDTLYKEARDRASNVEKGMKNLEKRNSIFIESKGMEIPMEGNKDDKKDDKKAEASLEDKIKDSIREDVKNIFSDKKPEHSSPEENEKASSITIEKSPAEPVMVGDKVKLSKDEYLNTFIRPETADMMDSDVGSPFPYSDTKKKSVDGDGLVDANSGELATTKVAPKKKPTNIKLIKVEFQEDLAKSVDTVGSKDNELVYSVPNYKARANFNFIEEDNLFEENDLNRCMEFGSVRNTRTPNNGFFSSPVEEPFESARSFKKKSIEEDSPIITKARISSLKSGFGLYKAETLEIKQMPE